MVAERISKARFAGKFDFFDKLWAHVTVRPSFCSVFVSGSCAQPDKPSKYRTCVGTVDLSITVEVN